MALSLQNTHDNVAACRKEQDADSKDKKAVGIPESPLSPSASSPKIAAVLCSPAASTVLSSDAGEVTRQALSCASKHRAAHSHAAPVQGKLAQLAKAAAVQLSECQTGKLFLWVAAAG